MSTPTAKTTVNGSIDGRVHFRKDPTTGQMMVWQGNAVATFDARGKKASTIPAPGVDAGNELDARMARLIDGYDAPEVQRVEIAGEEWFLKRLDFEGLTMVGLLQPRDGKRQMSITKRGNMTGLQAAMLFVVCVQCESDDSPLFPDWKSAYRFAAHKAPRMVDTNQQLFAAINLLNPEILPQDGVQADTVEAPDDDEDLVTAAAN